MATRLLIDAAYPEETRVVVASGNRLDEFYFESSSRKQLKGNIYLARVVRVEPSLQAAFVEYGGNRHGFLAFGDIHPDYYQISAEDRQALLREQAAEEAARRRAEDASADAADADLPPGGDADDADAEETEMETRETTVPAAPHPVGEDEDEHAPRRDIRRYKIQDVVKRRQVLLVQVLKEERGTKGAALSTYLSLAGRYCVLMPNTVRGGGVSRKIADSKDRKRLREIIDSLDVPDGVGLIVRTAGQQRTKADIRRDCEYLVRVWESIRELALTSTAPTLIYEEANLIKRAIRDLYSSDLTEVLVEGAAAYKAARNVMKMLMPSRARQVKRYEDRTPLFHRYQVEQQLDLMHSPRVQLRSGGYVVFSSTEALVAVDVNSGRSTRERNIEETALKTNLEAAEEIARQLRLRDLAGLIVIDFIDMEVARNNRAVERKLKEALKGDRARLQVGRISPFGLLELSRQRIRPSLLETSTEPCPTCGGAGHVRSTESAALHVLRSIEDEGIRGGAALTAEVPTAVAIYLLNQKRDGLVDVEQRMGLAVKVIPDPDLVPPAHRIQRSDTNRTEATPTPRTAVATEPRDDAAEDTAGPATEPTADDGEHKIGRRRRGKRGGRRHRRKNEETAAGPELTDDGIEVVPSEGVDVVDPAPEPEPRPKTRRTRRPRGEMKLAAAEPETPPAATPAEGGPADAPPVAAQQTRPRRRRRKVQAIAAAEEAPAAQEAEPDSPGVHGTQTTEGSPPGTGDHTPPDEVASEAQPKPRRRGWWQFGR